MRRRGFLKAMVAAAAGLLAVTPRVVRSVSAGTLTPAWTKEQEAHWTLEEWKPRPGEASAVAQWRYLTNPGN